MGTLTNVLFHYPVTEQHTRQGSELTGNYISVTSAPIWSLSVHFQVNQSWFCTDKHKMYLKGLVDSARLVFRAASHSEPQRALLPRLWSLSRPTLQILTYQGKLRQVHLFFVLVTRSQNTMAPPFALAPESRCFPLFAFSLKLCFKQTRKHKSHCCPPFRFLFLQTVPHRKCFRGVLWNCPRQGRKELALYFGRTDAWSLRALHALSWTDGELPSHRKISKKQGRKQKACFTLFLEHCSQNDQNYVNVSNQLTVISTCN